MRLECGPCVVRDWSVSDKLSAEKRRQIAKKAAKTRWGKKPTQS